jgi:hypothetical protein
MRSSSCLRHLNPSHPFHCLSSSSHLQGNVLHDIRQGDSYRNKKQELEELGITFYTHKQPRGRQGSGSHSDLRVPMPLSMSGLGSAAPVPPLLGLTSSDGAEALSSVPAPTDASILVQSSSSSSSNDTGTESVTQYCSEDNTVSHV